MSLIVLGDPPTLPPKARDIYMPIIATEQVNQVAAFYRLLTTDQRQQRATLGTCAALERAAEWKAADIAQYDYWQHQASNGEWPNTTVRRFGCDLPAAYGDGWNGVESLGAGSKDALPIFIALANSPRHRVHLFGENSFYRQQTHMGIGMVVGGRYGWVWVILIAPCL